jgi:hypothetical protein
MNEQEFKQLKKGDILENQSGERATIEQMDMDRDYSTTPPYPWRVHLSDGRNLEISDWIDTVNRVESESVL